MDLIKMRSDFKNISSFTPQRSLYICIFYLQNLLLSYYKRSFITFRRTSALEKFLLS